MQSTNQRRFPYQRTIWESNRRKILELLRERPYTFGELRKETRLSPSILKKHLRKLERDRSVSRRPVGRRIEYYLTETGQSIEERRQWLIAKVIQCVRRGAYDSTLSTYLYEAAKLAKNDPTRFEAQLQFVQELESIIDSNNYVHWIRKHPDETEQQRILKQELDKRLLCKTLPDDTPGHKAWLQDFLRIFRDTIAPSSQRFIRQNEARVKNRRNILSAIEAKPSTFDEIQKWLRSKAEILGQKEIAVWATTLSKHLSDLENEGMIERRISSGRIEYKLTEEGSRVEASRGSFFANALLLAKQCAKDPERARTLCGLADLAKQDPHNLEELLQFYQQAMSFYAKEAVIRWLQEVPPDKQKHVLNEELRKTLRTLGKADYHAEFATLLHAFLADIREIIEQEGL